MVMVLLVLVGFGNVLLQQLKRSAGDTFYRADNIYLMEEPYHEDGATCRFQVINLAMVGGSDVHLLAIHQAMGDSYPENPNFSLIEDPY